MPCGPVLGGLPSFIWAELQGRLPKAFGSGHCAIVQYASGPNVLFEEIILPASVRKSGSYAESD